MNEKHTSCDRIRDLALRRAEADGLSSAEEAKVSAHLSECEDCRAEHVILAAMADDGTTGPAEPLDDLARRRAIDDIINLTDQANQPQQVLEPQDARRSSAGRWIAVAAAAIAILAGGVSLYILQGESDTTPPVLQPVESSVKAFIALSEGDISLDESPAVSAQSLAAGQVLSVGDGRAAVHLKTGIRLIAQRGTSLRVSRNDGKSLEVSLDSGNVFASVTPGREGPPFAIVTREGRVEVTGTVFDVTSKESGVEVRVLRGKVTVVEKTGERRFVSSSEASAFAGGKIRPLEQADRDQLNRELSITELTDATDDATLEVSSVPTGARVSIGERLIGTTPLSIALRAGHYEMSLDREGSASVSELVSVSNGDRLSRIFNLKQATPAELEPGEQPNATVSTKQNVGKGQRPRPATASAKELLAQARTFRQSGDWRAAADAYSELIARHPSSGEARAALLVLGELQLEKLSRPRKALINFNRYLSSSSTGPLYQEALYDKARALRALGNTAAERTTLESFIARFPSAMQATKVRARLDELGTAPPQ